MRRLRPRRQPRRRHPQRRPRILRIHVPRRPKAPVDLAIRVRIPPQPRLILIRREPVLPIRHPPRQVARRERLDPVRPLDEKLHRLPDLVIHPRQLVRRRRHDRRASRRVVVQIREHHRRRGQPILQPLEHGPRFAAVARRSANETLALCRDEPGESLTPGVTGRHEIDPSRRRNEQCQPGGGQRWNPPRYEGTHSHQGRRVKDLSMPKSALRNHDGGEVPGSSTPVTSVAEVGSGEYLDPLSLKPSGRASTYCRTSGSETLAKPVPASGSQPTSPSVSAYFLTQLLGSTPLEVSRPPMSQR